MVTPEKKSNYEWSGPWGGIRPNVSPIRRLILLSLCILVLSACSAMVNSATNRLAGNLADAMANHDDAATVAAAGPAYLLLMDAMVRNNPEDAGLLVKASGFYAAYAGAFVQDPVRSHKLTARALDYALGAICVAYPGDCSLRKIPFQMFEQHIAGISGRDVPIYYALGVSWAGWIQARKDDFDAIAQLSRVELLMRRILDLEEGHMQGGVHLYLGVLSILLPPSLGGKADVARRHFDRAIEISNGRNLMAKVVYARHYARMLFDRTLHDRLLREVLAADPHRSGFVLLNTMAQDQARQLLETAPDYF